MTATTTTAAATTASKSTILEMATAIGSMLIDTEVSVRFQDEYMKSPSRFVEAFVCADKRIRERMVFILSHTQAADTFYEFITAGVVGVHNRTTAELVTAEQKLRELNNQKSALESRLAAAEEQLSKTRSNMTDAQKRAAALDDVNQDVVNRINRFSSAYRMAQKRNAQLEVALIAAGGDPYAVQ